MTDSADEIGERSMKAWYDAGQWMARRPVQVVATIVGLVLMVAIVYSAFQTQENGSDIGEIQRVFCSAEETAGETQRANCQKLLDQLLKNPTQQQAERLRMIVKETP